MKIIRRLGWAIAVYFVLVILVSLVAPSEAMNMGEDRCTGDWCIAVDKFTRGSGSSYEATLRVSTHASGPIRKNGVVVYILDGAGRRYDPVARPNDIPFNLLLDVEQTINVTRRFELPPDARDLSLVIDREGFPLHWFILGQGPFRKPPSVRLPPAVEDRKSTAPRFDISREPWLQVGLPRDGQFRIVEA